MGKHPKTPRQFCHIVPIRMCTGLTRQGFTCPRCAEAVQPVARGRLEVPVEAPAILGWREIRWPAPDGGVGSRLMGPADLAFSSNLKAPGS